MRIILGIIVLFLLGWFSSTEFSGLWKESGNIASAEALPLGFNAETYMKLNPDVKKAVHGNPMQAEEHYLRWGMMEERQYNPNLPASFDPQIYMDLNPWVRNFCRGNSLCAQDHFIRYGKAERRDY